MAKKWWNRIIIRQVEQSLPRDRYWTKQTYDILCTSISPSIASPRLVEYAQSPCGTEARWSKNDGRAIFIFKRACIVTWTASNLIGWRQLSQEWCVHFVCMWLSKLSDWQISAEGLKVSLLIPQLILWEHFQKTVHCYCLDRAINQHDVAIVTNIVSNLELSLQIRTMICFFSEKRHTKGFPKLRTVELEKTDTENTGWFVRSQRFLL